MSITTTQLATLGGGCFWCLEAVFEQLRGVHKVVSGYSGGEGSKATYEAVCSGQTGHAEVIRITFDPSEISFADLLDVFFATHDPTTLNRQGADAGTQYRSAIFCHDESQQRVALAKIDELNGAKIWSQPIVTQVGPLKEFFSAEHYHQGYFRSHPAQGYCQAVISPKVGKFRQKFAHRLRDSKADT